MDAVLEVFLQFVCVYTMKTVLPLLTFGRVRVPLHEPRRTPSPGSSTWVWYPLPGRRIGIYPDAAMFMGLAFWIVALLFGVTVWAFLT